DRWGADVEFWLINTYSADSFEECAKEYRDFKMWPLTYLRDSHQAVALVLGVERTAEVVAISTENWHVFYQGAIDDQLSEGAQKPAAEQTFLQAALAEFLAGKAVTTARTQAHGCRISFDNTAGTGESIYARNVGPILRQHCVECH